jgi:hypothetical protein
MPLTTRHLAPLECDALLEALHSPTHTLVRNGRHYMAQAGRGNTSGKHQVRMFTGRLVNMLERDGLVHFDPPQFPERVTLNSHGLILAKQLRDAQMAKAGAR